MSRNGVSDMPAVITRLIIELIFAISARCTPIASLVSRIFISIMADDSAWRIRCADYICLPQGLRALKMITLVASSIGHRLIGGGGMASAWPVQFSPQRPPHALRGSATRIARGSSLRSLSLTLLRRMRPEIVALAHSRHHEISWPLAIKKSAWGLESEKS